VGVLVGFALRPLRVTDRGLAYCYLEPTADMLPDEYCIGIRSCERASRALEALEVDVTAHELSWLLTDAQAQSRAAVLPRQSHVRLHERLKDLLLHVLRHSWPGIDDAELNPVRHRADRRRSGAGSRRVRSSLEIQQLLRQCQERLRHVRAVVAGSGCDGMPCEQRRPRWSS